MNDIIYCFTKTLDYLYGLVDKNHLEKEFLHKLDEQKENIEDLKHLIVQYEADISSYNTYDMIESNETVNKLIIIHTFITDFQWHISQIRGLKDEIMKYCSLKREMLNLNEDEQ